MHIDTAEVSEATRLLQINSPWQYHKHFCFVCHREWIGWPVKEGEQYSPPQKCNYKDCRSTVWDEPEKAAVERMARLHKLAKKRGTP